MLLNTPTVVKRVLHSPLLWPSILALLTLILGAWQYVGMNREFIVFPNPDIQFYAVSDQSNGGASEAIAYLENGLLKLKCTIRDQYEWPYCQVDFSFGSSYQGGLEGDRYEHITLNIGHKSLEPDETLRVFVRGYDDAFSQSGQYNTLMPNQIEYKPNRYPEGLTLELGRFIPATWWLSEMDLPIHQQEPTFERIPLIQVSTGSYVSRGGHELTIREIRLHGKWLQAEVLYSALLGLWVLTTLYWTLRHAWMLRANLTNERRHRLELEQLNSYLELSNRQLEDQAQHDDLTGLRNRAGLRDILYEAVQRAHQNNQPLCLMFLDIDHFKPVNDTYGHAMGDEILQRFARTLKGMVRSEDTVVRWGGEEFLLLCPNTNLEQARKLAEKLRTCIENESWPHRQRLTCSFGVAANSGSDPRALIEQADKALYRAKELGRNQVATGTSNGAQEQARTVSNVT